MARRIRKLPGETMQTEREILHTSHDRANGDAEFFPQQEVAPKKIWSKVQDLELNQPSCKIFDLKNSQTILLPSGA